MQFDVGTYIPEDSKVRLVCNIVEEHVNLKSIYIDGTKIEAVAGRYTFKLQHHD
jgi:hypothetical protein